MTSTKPSPFDITQYITALHLSVMTQHRAERILQDAEHAGFLSVRKPEALIAGALYIACILEKEPQTLATISHATGVSLKTVQKYKTALVRKLGIRKG